MIYLEEIPGRQSECHLFFKYPENADPHEVLGSLSLGEKIDWIHMSGRDEPA